MSEAMSIYCEARARADEINRRHYDGRMTYEEGEKAVLGLCHTQVTKRMMEEMEPVQKFMIEAANMKIVFGQIEVPRPAQEYVDHVEKKWMAVWDQIVNKKF